MIRRWVVLGILALVVVILMWDFYMKVLLYDPLRDMEKAAKEASGIGVGPEAGYIPAWSKDISGKNLFDPLRGEKPPETLLMKPGAALEPPPKMPELALKGIITNISGDYVALIEKDRAKAVPLMKGDKLDDVEVLDITEKTVHLRWLQEDIELSMEKIKTIKR